MLSAEIIRALREDHAEADKNLLNQFASLTQFIFRMLSIISTTLYLLTFASVIL